MAITSVTSGQESSHGSSVNNQ